MLTCSRCRSPMPRNTAGTSSSVNVCWRCYRTWQASPEARKTMDQRGTLAALRDLTRLLPQVQPPVIEE